MGEKIQHEKEMEESKDKFKNAVAGILIQRELFFYNWNYHIITMNISYLLPLKYFCSTPFYIKYSLVFLKTMQM